MSSEEASWSLFAFLRPTDKGRPLQIEYGDLLDSWSHVTRCLNEISSPSPKHAISAGTNRLYFRSVVKCGSIITLKEKPMAIAGNPKKMAQDIADGFVSLSPPVLKRYTPVDLKVILVNMGLVQREVRALQVPQNDLVQLKAKNTRLTRLNQAEVVLRSYCKKYRIPI
jgi:hypothetical protein